MGIKTSDISQEIEDKIKELKSVPNGDSEKLNEMLATARVNVSDEIQEEAVCLKIMQNGEQYTLGTIGNFSAIIGKAKSRKSFLVAILIAASIKGSILEAITASFSSDKQKILYFDTEQSRGHVQKALKRICVLAGVDEPEHLYTFCLRKYSPSVRLGLIEHCIYQSEGVGLVIIDGLRDLITSINDEEQATMILSKLLKWTETLNIHVITVLHQNKGDFNARGHVGTELINKAETVISVTKDEKNLDISIVAAEQCRDKDFRPFAFQIDVFGTPVLFKDFIPKSKEQKKAFTPADIPRESHIQIIKEVFAFESTPIYNQLVSQLLVCLNKHGFKVGENKAKNFLTYYQNENFIIKEVEKSPSIYRISIGLG